MSKETKEELRRRLFPTPIEAQEDRQQENFELALISITTTVGPMLVGLLSGALTIGLNSLKEKSDAENTKDTISEELHKALGIEDSLRRDADVTIQMSEKDTAAIQEILERNLKAAAEQHTGIETTHSAKQTEITGVSAEKSTKQVEIQDRPIP